MPVREFFEERGLVASIGNEEASTGNEEYYRLPQGHSHSLKIRVGANREHGMDFYCGCNGKMKQRIADWERFVQAMTMTASDHEKWEARVDDMNQPTGEL